MDESKRQYSDQELYEAGVRDGVESQRQVGPCGHPKACWVERVLPIHVRSNLAIEGGSEITHCCTVCASEQALRAEIAARNATIADWHMTADNRSAEIRKQMAELTTLIAECRKLVKQWKNQAAVQSVRSQGRRVCAQELAAILPKEK